MEVDERGSVTAPVIDSGPPVDVVAHVAGSFDHTEIEGRADGVRSVRLAMRYLLRQAEPDTGLVEVGITELMTATGLGKGTVQRALSYLRDAGWVVVVERGQKGMSVTVQRVQVGHPIRKWGAYMKLFRSAQVLGLDTITSLAPRSIKPRPVGRTGWIGGGEPLAKWAVDVIEANERSAEFTVAESRRIAHGNPAWRPSRDYSDLFIEGDGLPPF